MRNNRNEDKKFSLSTSFHRNNQDKYQNSPLSKTTPSFFQQFIPDSKTINFYSHIHHIQPFAVHHNELDFNQELENLLSIYKKQKIGVTESKMIKVNLYRGRRSLSEEIKHRCLQIIKQPNNYYRIKGNMFKQVLQKSIKDEQQEVKVAKEMIENCQKDHEFYKTTLKSFKQRIISSEAQQRKPIYNINNKRNFSQQDLHTSQKVMRKYSQSSQSKSQKYSSNLLPSPRMKVELTALQQKKGDLLKKNNEVFIGGKAEATIPINYVFKNQDQQQINRMSLNKKKKYVKSYILKREKARCHFLNLNKNKRNLKSTTLNDFDRKDLT